jgi:hypothetical protein
MGLQKSVEDSRIIFRKLKEESPRSDRIQLKSLDFINLLNDGAEGPILNEPVELNKNDNSLYLHKAVYEGVLITSYTLFKISDSKEFGI